jgi:hypothetical protein
MSDVLSLSDDDVMGRFFPLYEILIGDLGDTMRYISGVRTYKEKTEVHLEGAHL